MFEENNVDTPAAFDAAIAAGKSPEALLKVYKDWALDYDKQMADIGWKTPQNVANVLVEVVNPPKDAKILDVAAGTGLICHFLHQRGYQNFDALDPSAEMLQVAKSRNIYDKFYQNFVGGGVQLPYKKATYDVVVMSGAFVDGHCPLDAWDDIWMP